ncbi:hypothetical protein I6F66_02730 [Pseudoalteromonas sp. NZS100_1]|uniref:hypothetical protein n=1 Tax=Pseudoalteromonas sp. NZS100_1 TaxID=2792073 RepID=UPI0018CEC99A|nr:hypothetical protein [Pseudoalteromonas sp. NZS100_1]MBH0010987.1 hypothetical protein [Pseudoalteromonas sp. NZS100_1]
MEGITIQVSEHSELQNIVNQVAQSKEPVNLNFVFQNITFVVQSQLVSVNPVIPIGTTIKAN